jgi:hypothetical protein
MSKNTSNHSNQCNPNKLELPRVVLALHRIQLSKFHEKSFKPDESQQLSILIFQRRKPSNWREKRILNVFSLIPFLLRFPKIFLSDFFLMSLID